MRAPAPGTGTAGLSRAPAQASLDVPSLTAQQSSALSVSRMAMRRSLRSAPSHQLLHQQTVAVHPYLASSTTSSSLSFFTTYRNLINQFTHENTWPDTFTLGPIRHRFRRFVIKSYPNFSQQIHRLRGNQTSIIHRHAKLEIMKQNWI